MNAQIYSNWDPGDKSVVPGPRGPSLSIWIGSEKIKSLRARKSYEKFVDSDPRSPQGTNPKTLVFND